MTKVSATGPSVTPAAASLPVGGPVAFWSPRRVEQAAGAVGLAVLLALARWYYPVVEHHYLLFHSLAEMFSVAVAAAIFMVAWNSRRISSNACFLVLGVAYLFVGLIDIIHTLAYEGMGVFAVTGANLATQLWVAGRYLESLSIALAFAFIGRKVRAWPLMGACAAAFVCILLAIFVWPVFPACYVPGKVPPLTAFKVGSEYVIVTILAGALALLWWRRGAFSRRVMGLMAASIVATMASELVFTLYAKPTDFWNMMGHVLKLVSFFLIYRALVATGLREPYEVLFRDLKASQEQLAAARDELAGRYRQSENILGRTLTELESEVRDRIDAEDAMWATEARYRSLVENIPAITYTGALDEDSSTLFVSPQVETILGYTPEEFAEPDAWTNCIHPADLSRVLKEIAKARGPDGHLAIEYRMIARDGREVWVHDEAGVVADRLGKPLCLQGVMFDITELKHVEHALRDSERRLEQRVVERTAELSRANEELREAEAAVRQSELRLRVALANAAVFVFSQDRDLRYDWKYSPEGHLSPGEVIGKTDRDIHPLEQAEQLEALKRRALTEGKPVRGEVRLTYHGVDHIYDLGVEGLRDELGRIIGIIGAGVDVSQHKAAEERIRRLNEGLEQRVVKRTVELAEANRRLIEEAAQREGAQQELQRERQRLFSVLNVLPGYVMLVGRDCAVRFANHTYLDLFGNPGKRHCYEMQFQRDGRCPNCRINDVLDERRPLDWEWRSPMTGRFYHVWAYPFADVDGTDAVLHLGIDVTDRKTLERQVIEASEAERRSIGHELHDTLGQNLTGLALIIKGLIGRVKKSSPSDAEAGEQLVELVNESVAQVRSLARGLDPAGLDEAGLIGALEELADRTERLFKVPCQLRCADGVAVRGAATTTHLYHIAREAVNNAVKHAQASHISVTLQSDVENVSLIIADDGVGIGDNVRGSAGMGLRIMRYRASVLGADLSVRRGGAGGTVVKCVLPADRANPQE